MRAFLSAVLLVSSCGQSMAASQYDWLKNKESANAVVMDRRFDSLLRNTAPSYRGDLGFGRGHVRLSTEFSDGIGIPFPEEITIVENTYISLGGCQPHDCPNKSFLWVDSKEQKSIGAIVHSIFDGRFEENPSLLVFSKQYQCNNLPEQFVKALNSWLGAANVQVLHFRFIGIEGKVEVGCFKL